MNPTKIAQKLISYKTITPKEKGIYKYIQSLLPDFTPLRADKNGVKNLFLTKDFGGADPLHFCFVGHVDVVPVGQGWRFDPFGGEILEEFLYGRGAQDMKGGGGGVCMRLARILRQSCPRYALKALCFTHKR